MKSHPGLAFLAACLGGLLVTGCGDDARSNAPDATTNGAGGDGIGGSGAGTATTTGTGGTGTGGGADLTWTPLITANWQLGPGSENTSDVHSVTVDHDIYVGAIRPIAPTGTHHTVLGLNDLDTGHILYASGVGTNALVFPEGIGLKLAAGDTVVLQLHLFNTSNEPLIGTSGIEIVEVAPTDIDSEADLFLPGPFDFAIPPNQTYTHSGKCTVKAPQSLFAIFPHMHQLGSHFKSTVTVGGEQQVIHDDDYAFVHQAFIPFSPIALQPGDSIETECTWKNTTSSTVIWGESSTTEMCFSILYRYPKQDDNGFCSK